MSNGDFILNTFGTRPRSQFAPSSCRTRPTLLVRLTDVVVNRNLTQTASTLNRLRSSVRVPQPLKLYGQRSYTDPVYLYLAMLRSYCWSILCLRHYLVPPLRQKMLLKSYKKIYIEKIPLESTKP